MTGPLQKVIDACAHAGMQAPFRVTCEDAAGQKVIREVGEDYDRLVMRSPATPAPVQLPLSVTVEDAVGEQRVFDILMDPKAVNATASQPAADRHLH